MRRLVHALIVVMTLIVGATAAAVIVSQTAWFKNWLRGYIVRSANAYLNGTLSIERLGGNLFFGIEMEDIGVSLDGKPVVAVKDIGLDYNVFQLLTQGLSVDNIRLNRPVIYLRRDGDTWSLSRLVKKQETEADRSGPARPIAIDAIGISGGSLIVDGPVGTSGVQVPKRFDNLDAKLSFKYEPVRYSIEITHVSFRGTEPAIAVNALSGGVAVKDDTVFVDRLALRTAESSLTVDGAVQQYLSKPAFNLQVASDKLSLPELARLVPALAGVNLQPAFDVKVDGPLDRMNVVMNARSSAGALSGKLLADVQTPGQSVAGTVSVKNLDLAPILKDPRQKSDITADARVNLRADSFANINSLRGDVALSAKRVASGGYVAGPVRTTAHISGRTADVDAKASAYGAAATATGRVTLPNPDAKGATAQQVAFNLRGRIQNVDLRRLPRNLNVPPAATRATAQYHVAGNGSSDIRGDARFAESSVAGTTIADGSTVQFAKRGDELTYATDATVSDLDLQRIGREFRIASLAQDRYRSTINGHVVASGQGTDPADARFSVDAKVDLASSRVGDVEITRASVDGTYRDSAGEIRALDIVGRDVNITASGPLALNETGQSNLKLHADSPSLDTVAKLFDQPLTGIASLDATVTGNRRELKATGHFVGDGIKYEENGALTAATDFTATVPNLEVERARVSATTNATFVTLAGQNINELTAKTDYIERKLDFDATARQPQRSLAAAGSLVLHPDHQEVHLQRIGLQSQGVQWRMADGAEATVNYAAGALSVEGLKLVNGDQEIRADGRFGSPGDTLNVTLNNFDVATVDAVLLRQPQFTGRLNGSAVITGRRDDPSVDATFEVAQGGFRQFRYESLKGTAKYAQKGVDVDARLEQNPTTWLTVKGYAPLTVEAPKPEYNLHVDSSRIDLGLVQGFTNALTNVTGTVQAKVDVTGAAGDPHPNGAVTIENGAFMVAPTGVAYSGVNGRIDLQPEKIHIEEIRIVDNHQSPASITGDLAIHERELSGVQIAIKANDFKVIDNKMGNVRVNSDLRIAGQLSAPRLEGALGISTGQVNLDEIMAQIGDSAYATKQTEFAASAADTQGQTPAPSAFEALYAFVHLTVPNDLVIKASDLRAPGAPIGLGALNITLGGDLTVHKAPWDQPRIYGDVTTIRGNYDFQGRRFEILRDGRVRFEGTDNLDPALDLRTQRIIQAVVANVNLRGTLSKPEIALSSTPPLEEADILSLIVFNQPINQLGEGQQISLAQRAQGMALGAAAGQLAQSIGSALGVDTFELNLAPETGTGPTVTIGEQVGQNLYVKVQQGIGDQSQTNFILEYELAKWLRFRTNVLQGSATQTQLFQRQQGSGADLLFFFGF